jgi:hypothetical protein
MTQDLNQHVLSHNNEDSSPERLQRESSNMKLTFYVENDTTKQQHQQLVDSDRSNYYDDVVVESYESPIDKGYHMRHTPHDTYCILSAFLYFITITTFAYLFVLWIRQKMHVQMELMHWW